MLYIALILNAIVIVAAVLVFALGAKRNAREIAKGVKDGLKDEEK